ncbi:hypothetical protein JCM5350_002196 [Sporobolomyces pararoseus]
MINQIYGYMHDRSLRTRAHLVQQGLGLGKVALNGKSSYVFIPLRFNLDHSDDIWKQLVKQQPTSNVEPEQWELEHEFDSEDDNLGAPLRISVKQILGVYDQQKSFGFRCILSGNEFPHQSFSFYNSAFNFFDSSSYADTVFVIHQAEGHPSHILACKEILVSESSHFRTLFQSGFSETNSKRRFDIEKLSRYEDEDGSSVSPVINDQLHPFLPSNQREESAPRAPRDGNDSTERSPSSEPNRKRIKLEGAVEESSSETGDVRSLNVVDIREIDFRTYRAMIRYLHVPTVPFHPLASEYLVEKSKNNALDESPLDWLWNKFCDLDQLNYEGVDPCSSSAMYRLADLYDMEDLRDLSLDFIVRSLTVENAAYELFSPLSFDYEAVQKPILEFFVKNWRAVRRTDGFKAVLKQFSLGNLSRGEGIMEKIFGMALLS